MDEPNVHTKRLLEAELDEIAQRLQTGATALKAGPVGGDFLDVAQDLEHQEVARLNASRLTQRARRLEFALSRVLTGEYGVCAECGTSISPKRLRAVPDVTTCVACQEQLERASRAVADSAAGLCNARSPYDSLVRGSRCAFSPPIGNVN